jgi:hypothetical protein
MKRRFWALAVVLGAASACTDDDGATTGKASWPADLQMDWQEYRCEDPQTAVALPMCPTPSAELNVPAVLPPTHVPMNKKIEFPFLAQDAVPTSGPHRGDWAVWGRYTFLPPQRWLHNLEHGGMAVLYHPCAPQSVLDELNAWVTARKAADRQWKYVMTPYPGLDAPWSLATWEWRLKGTCWNTTDADAFADAHYDQAPEQVMSGGAYDWLWMGY